MNATFNKRVAQLNAHERFKYLTGIRRGFEKECLRVDEQGKLAKTPHPNVLGWHPHYLGAPNLGAARPDRANPFSGYGLYHVLYGMGNGTPCKRTQDIYPLGIFWPSHILCIRQL